MGAYGISFSTYLCQTVLTLVVKKYEKSYCNRIGSIGYRRC
jgi:hypothetical protein